MHRLPFLAAAILGAWALATASLPASAAFMDEAAEAVIDERSAAMFRRIGVGDLYRFNRLEKALAGGTAGLEDLDTGLELGHRFLDSEPMFAGFVFGAIARAYSAGTLPPMRQTGEALYWNAVAYDRVCAKDGELCQALAASALSGRPGSGALKATALRYIDFADAVASNQLPPDIAANAAAQCRLAHELMASRAAAEGRGDDAFYGRGPVAACDPATLR